MAKFNSIFLKISSYNLAIYGLTGATYRGKSFCWNRPRLGNEETGESVGPNPKIGRRARSAIKKKLDWKNRLKEVGAS